MARASRGRVALVLVVSGFILGAWLLTGSSVTARLGPARVSGSGAGAKPGSAQWSQQPVEVRHAQLFGVSCASVAVCTAVGDISVGPREGHLTPLVERWNGHDWVREQTAHRIRGDLYGVSCPSARACMAVGATNLAERWNGHQWSVQRVPHANEYLFAVSCSSATACTAVGSRSITASHRSVPLAARWNGRDWSVQATPNVPRSNETWLQGVSCPSATVCTAVGFAGIGRGDAKLPVAERWNGHRWSLQTIPGPTASHQPDLQGVSCPSTSACTAVGDYIRGRSVLTLTEHWDGRHWSAQETRNPTIHTVPESGTFFYRVSCPSAQTCTAVGAEGGFESTITLAERWNGRAWSVQRTVHPSPNHASVLSGVSCPTATVCTAVGSYDNWHGPGVPLAERYS